MWIPSLSRVCQRIHSHNLLSTTVKHTDSQNFSENGNINSTNVLPLVHRSTDDQEALFDQILSGQLDFPLPYWDNVSDTAKVSSSHIYEQFFFLDVVLCSSLVLMLFNSAGH